MRIAVLILIMSLVMECHGWAAQPANPALASAPAVGIATTAATAPASAQGLQFEVATIKPSDPAQCCSRTYGMDGRTLSTNNTYLQWLIKWAYGLQDKQVVGGPEWIGVDRYNVTGQVAGTATLTMQQAKLAMQRLLADRFQLKFHHETRDVRLRIDGCARRRQAHQQRSDQKPGAAAHLQRRDK